MKYFYSRYIVIESLIAELHNMDLSGEERLHLASLIDSSLHHTILDAVLSELSETDKKVFLSRLKEGSHSKIWQFLNEKVDNIEDKIKKAADDLIKEMREDVKQAGRLK